MGDIYLKNVIVTQPYQGLLHIVWLDKPLYILFSPNYIPIEEAEMFSHHLCFFTFYEVNQKSGFVFLITHRQDTTLCFARLLFKRKSGLLVEKTAARCYNMKTGITKHYVFGIRMELNYEKSRT